MTMWVWVCVYGRSEVTPTLGSLTRRRWGRVLDGVRREELLKLDLISSSFLPSVLSWFYRNSVKPCIHLDKISRNLVDFTRSTRVDQMNTTSVHSRDLITRELHVRIRKLNVLLRKWLLRWQFVVTMYRNIFLSRQITSVVLIT